MTDRVYYSSFYHPNLTAVLAENHHVSVAPLYGAELVTPWLYASLFAAKAIHPHLNVLTYTPEVVKECHMRGIRVNFWTVDNPNDMRRLAEAGCDALITNKPDVAITTLKEAGLY